MADQYVVPLSNGWGVRSAISREVARIFDTKEAAIDFAKEKAEAQNSAVFLEKVGSTAHETEKLDDFRPVAVQLENHSIMVDGEYQPRHD